MQTRRKAKGPSNEDSAYAPTNTSLCTKVLLSNSFPIEQGRGIDVRKVSTKDEIISDIQRLRGSSFSCQSDKPFGSLLNQQDKQKGSREEAKCWNDQTKPNSQIKKVILPNLSIPSLPDSLLLSK